MSQNAQEYSSVLSNEPGFQKEGIGQSSIHLGQSEANTEKQQAPNQQLDSVMSDLSRLSKSFVSSFQNLEGQVEQLNGQIQNISEQRSEAIEEKQTLADRLQNLLSILPSGVVVLDGRGVVRECNAVAINILGRPLYGESWLNVINRAFLPQADDGHQISLKDGRKVHIETRALDPEPGQMIVLTDMTKTRQLQAQLSQQQKLSSMGIMIASLAHQIRTPLAAAMLYGSHLKGEELTDTKKQEFSRHLMERLQFMDRQISDMLNFVKGEKKQKGEFKLANFIESVQSICGALSHPIGYQITFNKMDNIAIYGDSDSLVGAVINLVNNAIDATNDEQPVCIKFSFTNKNDLSIEVKDSGIGISREDQKKLFEPFYSTKNHGNGLGLAIVYGVVLEHQGTVEIDSEVGKGTRFIVKLPLIRIPKDAPSDTPKMQTNDLGEAAPKETKPASNDDSQETIYER